VREGGEQIVGFRGDSHYGFCQTSVNLIRWYILHRPTEANVLPTPYACRGFSVDYVLDALLSLQKATL